MWLLWLCAQPPGSFQILGLGVHIWGRSRSRHDTRAFVCCACDSFLMHSFGRHQASIAIVIASLFLLTVFYLSPYPRTFFLPKGPHSPTPVHFPTQEYARPRVCRHVAVASAVGWHFEIYMSIVGVLEKQLCPLPEGSVRVYTPGAFGYGFDNIIDELGLYHGNFSSIETFFNDVDSTRLFPEDEGSPMIDMIFLGTCESE
jgi:hypothetical protein